MKIDYTLLAVLSGAAYAILKAVSPDFPLTEQGLLLLVIWALVKLGVEVVGIPVRAALRKVGLLPES